MLAPLDTARDRRSRLRILIALPALAATTALAAPASMQAMRSLRGHERIVLASSPDPADPNIAAQRRILSDWSQGAADRDVRLVAVAGPRVEGASDPAASLRKRYGLTQGKFEALLIGKDGHVALRSAQPLDAETLQRAIDAMPMRRNGGR